MGSVLLSQIRLLFPEVLLTIALLLVIVIGLLLPKEKKGQTVYLGIAGLLGSILLTISLYPFRQTALFYDMIVLDPFALFFKIFFLATTLIILLFTLKSNEFEGANQGEYTAFFLAITLGMIMLASSVDLVMIVISLELISLNSYILTGYLKGNRRSSEAALKYVIYGATATGMMLYGMSLLYGITGTTKLIQMAPILFKDGYADKILLISIIFILVGFGFKIAMVPYHMWAPDVYEGAPTSVTAFLSVGPKAAGFAVLIRFFYTAMAKADPLGKWLSTPSLDWPMLIAILSAITMTVGNLIAINQNNLKRMLAYSSIAHAGYMLMGFVLLIPESLQAVIFYLIIYLFMNLGAFLVLVALAPHIDSENIKAYQGLGWRAPFVAIVMSIFLFSLTGIPPLAGFIGKFLLFAALIKEKVYWLAIIGVVNSVISLYYYARIIKTMLLEHSPTEDIIVISPYYKWLLIALAIPTVVIGIYWEPIERFVIFSMKFLYST